MSEKSERRPANESEIEDHVAMIAETYGVEAEQVRPIVSKTLRMLDGVCLATPDLLEAGRYLTADRGQDQKILPRPVELTARLTPRPRSDLGKNRTILC